MPKKEDIPRIHPAQEFTTVNIGLEKDTDPESPWLFRFTVPRPPEKAEVVGIEGRGDGNG